MKWMDIKEFVDKGYLQELNRQFLHPLGFALAVAEDTETGEVKLAGIWDHRGDPEGIYFDEGDLSLEKFDVVLTEQIMRAPARIEKLGYWIQPIPSKRKVQRYRARAVGAKAVQFDGSNYSELRKLRVEIEQYGKNDGSIYIYSEPVWHHVEPGDWVLRDDFGRVHVFSDPEFHKWFEDDIETPNEEQNDEASTR